MIINRIRLIGPMFVLPKINPQLMKRRLILLIYYLYHSRNAFCVGFKKVSFSVFNFKCGLYEVLYIYIYICTLVYIINVLPKTIMVDARISFFFFFQKWKFIQIQIPSKIMLYVCISHRSAFKLDSIKGKKPAVAYCVVLNY